MQTDDLERGSKQMGQILEAVAIGFKSMGYAVVIQPRMIGRYATSLIVGETRDAAARNKLRNAQFGSDLQHHSRSTYLLARHFSSRRLFQIIPSTVSLCEPYSDLVGGLEETFHFFLQFNSQPVSVPPSFHRLIDTAQVVVMCRA